MDGNRFDNITKWLAADASRRSFLQRTAATVAALAGLGGATATDAARRPTPTPKPVSCPGSQTWNGSACACPGGTSPCGPDCCPAGAACCDNACCYGTCYGEELCCPTGQIVCGGVCLAPGQCCSNDDCGAGLACIGNSCICQASTSCATAGLKCGTYTDECGAIHDCGVCAEPQTCGGGGTAGVCGCTPTTTCDGRCGDLTTNCGTSISCGDCSQCQSCVNGICENIPNPVPCTIDACTILSTCSNGVCQGGQPLPCQSDPNDRCNRTVCDPTLGCVSQPINEGGSCKSLPCDPGVCRDGSCLDAPTVCPECQSCQGGTCLRSNDGGTCGDGLHCYAGNCCNMPTIGGEVPDDPNVLMSCGDTDQICCDAASGPCCPGTSECCDICVTVEGDSGRPPYNMCCVEAQQCGENCCWNTDTCVDGRCVNRRMVCAGDVACNDECCGADGDGTGTCCGSDAYCVGGECLPRQDVVCNSHATCEALYDPGAVCAYMSINLGTGQVNSGTCCPGGYWRLNTSGPDTGQYTCCSPETHPTQNGCCAFPDSECPSCTCSRTTIRRWGN